MTLRPLSIGPYDVHGNHLQSQPRSVVIVVDSSPYESKGFDFLLVDATTGAITILLPTNNYQGSRIQVKKIDNTVNTVTVSGNGPNIDGEATYVLTVQHESVSVVYGSSQWWIE